MRKDWEYKKLGEIAFYPNDKISVDKIESNHYVGVENLLKDKAGILFSDQLPNATTATRFKYNDILLGNIRPYLKKIWLSNIEGGASGDVIVIRSSSDNILPNYLFKLLSSDKFFDYFNLYTKGAKMPRGDKNAIAKFIVPIPPKSTQLAIVAELDKLNEMIRLKKQQLEDYDQLAQSIFYEMFGDPVENEKGWEVKKLGEVCINITDGDHMPPPKASKGIPFITISNINKETRELNFENTFFVSEEYYNNLKDNRKARLGDLLYTVTGSYGIPVTVETNIPFCFQRHIALIRPKQNVLSTKYLCFWVLCENVKSMADRAATGIAQKTVGLNTIRNFKVILPPLPLQQQFAARIEAIEQQKQQVKDAIKDLETLLASRMQYWFDFTPD